VTGTYTHLTIIWQVNSCSECIEFNRCRIIFDKIDTNSDEKVTEEELENWIKYVQTRYLRADTDRQWSEHNPDNSPTLSWASYKHSVYAFIKGAVMELFVTYIVSILCSM